MKLKITFWMVMLTVVFSHSHALAGMCVQSTPFMNALAAQVVFEGGVEQITKIPVKVTLQNGNEKKVESEAVFFKVSKIWKGNRIKKKDYVGMLPAWGFAGSVKEYEFTEGKKYLVFADQISQGSGGLAEKEYPKDVLLEHRNCDEDGAIEISEGRDLSLWLQAKLLFASLF